MILLFIRLIVCTHIVFWFRRPTSAFSRETHKMENITYLRIFYRTAHVNHVKKPQVAWLKWFFVFTFDFAYILQAKPFYALAFYTSFMWQYFKWKLTFTATNDDNDLRSFFFSSSVDIHLALLTVSNSKMM